MNPDHIDFISSYCDRWCERCSFTRHCSAYTAKIAVEMCGDEAAGIELAFGRPLDDEGVERSSVAVEIPDTAMSPEEEAEWDRNEARRREKLEATPVMKRAWAFLREGHGWLKAHRELLSNGDTVVREALEIATWDVTFIPVKVHRALNGKDRQADGEDFCVDNPVQNDWNGSAKIALISIARSVQAWSVLASATGMEIPAALASQLTDLRAEMERAFPTAWAFRRPGFDEET